MGEIRPKTCEGRELTKDQLVLGSQPSLESPHNSVHGAMGRSSVMFR